MRKICVIAFMVFVLSCGAAFAQKIAVVDLDAAMNKTEAGKKAIAELTADFEKAKAKAQKLSTEMETMGKDLETQRSVLAPDMVQKKLADIQKKKVELERLEKDTNEELQRKQMQLTGAMMQDMKPIIEAYAKENKIDVVIERNAGALYAAPEVIITDEIVKRFDAQWKNKK